MGGPDPGRHPSGLLPDGLLAVGPEACRGRPGALRPTLGAMTPAPSAAIGAFSSEVLEIETEGHVATLWLNRPEKRNALGPAFWSDLPRAMAALGSDPDLRAVVIAARGPHFTVGLDLVAMAGLAGPTAGGNGAPLSMAARSRSARAEILRMQASVTAVAECPLPVIAAVHGYCIGGGVDLASRRVTSAWPAPTPSSRCARPRWPSWPTSGACSASPHHRQGPRGRAGLHRQGHHRRARAEAIGLVNGVSSTMPPRCWRRRGTMADGRSPPTRPWPSRAPRRS